VDDALYDIVGAGGPETLRGAEGRVRNAMDLAQGIYTKQNAKKPNLVAELLGGIWFRKSGEYSFALRRSAWAKLYDQAFMPALKDLGVPDAELKLLRDFVSTELPPELSHLHEHVGAIVWRAIATGRALCQVPPGSSSGGKFRLSR